MLPDSWGVSWCIYSRASIFVVYMLVDTSCSMLVISRVYDAVPMVVWLYCVYALYGFNGFSLGCNAMLELVDNPVS